MVPPEDKDAGLSRRDFLKAGAAAGAFALIAAAVPEVAWGAGAAAVDPSRLGELVNPWDVAFGPAGELYVANAGRYGVVRLTGAERSYIGRGAGTAPGQLNFPMGLDVAARDGSLYVADTNNGRIVVFDPAGEYASDFGRPGYLDGEFLRPKSVCCFRDGVLVADTRNHRVQYIDLAGQRLVTKEPATRAILGGLGEGPGDLKLPRYVACDADGLIYVADGGLARVTVYALDGRIVRTPGVGAFAEPAGVVVAPDGTTYVADAGAAKVLAFYKNGRLASDALPGLKGLQKPRGLALWEDWLACADPAAARVFITRV